MVVLGMVNMAVCPLALPKRKMEELEELEELKLHGFIMVATLHHRSIYLVNLMPVVIDGAPKVAELRDFTMDQLQAQ